MDCGLYVAGGGDLLFPKMKIMQLLKNATGEFGTAYTEWKLRITDPGIIKFPGDSQQSLKSPIISPPNLDEVHNLQVRGTFIPY